MGVVAADIAGGVNIACGCIVGVDADVIIGLAVLVVVTALGRGLMTE